MKIEQTTTVFQPITITLESYDEAATLMGLFGFIFGDGSSRDICDCLYFALEKKDIKPKAIEICSNRITFVGE